MNKVILSGNLIADIELMNRGINMAKKKEKQYEVRFSNRYTKNLKLIKTFDDEPTNPELEKCLKENGFNPLVFIWDIKEIPKEVE